MISKDDTSGKLPQVEINNYKEDITSLKLEITNLKQDILAIKQDLRTKESGSSNFLFYFIAILTFIIFCINVFFLYKYLELNRVVENFESNYQPPQIEEVATIADSTKMAEPKELPVEFVDPQFRTITGKVTDENGVPIEFASVKVKGTRNGLVTDSVGNFWLSLSPKDKQLVISAIGFKSKVISLGETFSQQFNIQLERSL